MDAPEAPNPYATARAQEKMNKNTAITQQELNMINQTTPYGSLTYNQTGTTESGNPIWNATQTLSPENQALYDSYMRLAGQHGEVGNLLMDASRESLSTPFDFGAAQATELTDMQRTFLDPQWSNQQSGLETQLFNQGVQPGTEAYRRAMEEFSTNRQRAYDQNYLTSYQTAADMALRERNQPLTELNAFLTGSQPQTPSFAQTPQASVQSPDLMGAVNQNYANETSQYNAMLGGLFGLGSNVLGGWARSGFAMPSDRRLKEDIERVGETDDGLPVYTYRYKGSPVTMMGVMADEVAEEIPDAVVSLGMFDAVDYSMVT